MVRVPPPRTRGTSNDFAERHDQLLGRRTGKPAVRPKAVTRANRAARIANYPAGARHRATGIGLGTSKLKAKQERAYENVFGQIGQVGSANQAGVVKENIQQVYDTFSRELKQSQQMALAADMAERESLGQESFPELSQGGEYRLSNTIDEKYLGGVVGRGMDILSRPVYAAANTAIEEIEGKQEREEQGRAGNWFEEFLSQGKDLGVGFWQGLGGYDKKDWGQTYETFKNYPNAPIPRALQRLEESHPNVEQAIAIGAGVAGNFVLDPTDKLFGLNKVGVLHDSGVMNEATYHSAVGEAARKGAEEWTNNVLANYAGASTWRPSAQAVIDNAMKAADEYLTASEVSIRGGPNRGRYSTFGSRLDSTNIANRVAESIRRTITRPLADRVQGFFKSLDNNKPWSPSTVAAYAATNDDFAKFISDVSDELVQKNRINPNASLDEVINSLTPADKDWMTHKMADLVDTYDADLASTFDKVYGDIRNASYNTVGIRVGPVGGKGTKVIPMKTIGKAYNRVAKKFTDGSVDMASTMNFNSIFPGKLSLLHTRHQAVGVKAFDDFKRRVEELAGKHTREEAKTIHYAIENNITLSGEMEVSRQELKKMYREMFTAEIAAGARPEGSAFADNYVYVYNKGGKLKDRTEFKIERKQNVRHTGANNSRPTTVGRYTTAEAKARGLKPVEDGFNAIVQRYMKHQRDITRAGFLQDIVENYGISGKAPTTRIAKPITSLARGQRGQLWEVPYNQLPEHMRLQIKDTGGAYYLPGDMADMVKYHDDMTKWHSATMNRFARNFARVMGIYKTLQTVPFMGFHSRNMIGDVYMGLLDNIPVHTYGEVARKFAETKAGGNPTFTLIKGVKDVSTHELWELYETNANSGFFIAETGGVGKLAPKDVIPRAYQGAKKFVRNISTWREDWGRLVHFKESLAQEMQGLWDDGMRDLDKIQSKALDAAVWRVNNYKFDYNALTMFEKKLRTFGVPFYTYMRKVIPTLIQSAFINPKYITSVHRYMQQNTGTSADEFNWMNVPDYIRNMGYAALTDEKEPWIMRQDILPTSALGSVRFGGLMEGSGQQMFGDITSKLNPAASFLYEEATGKDVFTGAPTGNLVEHIMDELPIVKEVRNTFQESDRSAWEQILSSRMGLGLPINKLSQEQQAFAQNERQDEFIDMPLREFNRSQDMFSVQPENIAATGGQVTYVVRDRHTLDESGQATIVYQTRSIQNAIEWAKQHLPEGYESRSRVADNYLYNPANLPEYQR